jgi:protein-S-isoprenylcysteine O-methyltransferase Ste14
VEVPLVFRHGPAEIVFLVAVLAWAVFENVLSVVQRLRARTRGRLDPSYFVLVACAAGGVVLGEVLGRRGPLVWPGGLVWPVAAGVTLIAAGIALRLWSIITLGRFFQYQIQIQPGHQVVTSGPYRYVRHPSYTGITLVLAGIGLGCGDVLSLPAVLGLGLTGLLVRIRAEERQLAGALGDSYANFAAGRKRLVPGVW